MSDLAPEVLKLDLSDDIFKGIKFFISGEVQEKIIDLLKRGGAERLNYFSDYVTHLIVGNSPEENDISDANDVYEIPALTPKWVIMCAHLKRLVSTKPYLYVPGGKFLKNAVFCFSNIGEDLKYLWSLITYNGGIVQLNLTKRCDYLVTTDTRGLKYQKAENLGPDRIKIVTPDWIVETIRNKSLADPALFHPKLINWPKPVKHESTTAITGFEPEQTEDIEKNEEKVVPDSTQALLEKLKQRMPWNQPSTPKTTPADPIAPPNVIAPSFLQKGPSHPSRAHMNQVSQSLPITPQSPVSQIPSSPLPNQHIPRSTVHHTPTQPSHEQSPSSNIVRMIGQQQPRPNLQQMRAQLGQGQLHQQLLQQRMQNPQNMVQRSPTGQLSVQQQLIQQQIAQRQLLQTQLNQQQRQAGNQQAMGQNQQIGPNSHMNQLSQQQIAQFQQQQLLKQQQQLQLGQNQQQLQLGQNQQQLQLGQNQQQLQLGQNQQQILGQNQQMLQNQVLQQNQLNPQQNVLSQQQNQLNQQQQTQGNQQQNQLQQNQLQQQQQIQMTSSQNFIHQNQQLQQKQQFLNQQQTVTSQQQIIQNQSNLTVQQFVNQNFNNQNQNSQEMNMQNIQQQQQQQPANQQHQNLNQHLNAQVLNQQLSSQNLGPQLNQQQLNQQLSQQQNQQLNQQQNQMNPQLNQQQNQLNQQLNQQQNQINQQLVQQNALLNQQLNQQTPMGQPLNQPDQLNQQLNQQGQLSQLNQQQSLNQQSLEQGLSQNINQTLNQQLSQGISQHLQQQQLNRQNLQQQLNNQQMQVQQQQQGVSQQQQQISQINQQLNSSLPQQVVRTQFQQQNNVNQQILINQQSPQTPSPQRTQINQHLWAQQPSQVPGQQIIRHSVNVVQQPGPRVQWSPNAQQGNVVPQRQFIQLDARTHNELQKMPPEQQAMFVAKLQRQRQLVKQVQQRGGGASHILIRGNVPPGLTTQQQFQWLQQQAKQQGIVLPPNIQQQNVTPGTLTQPVLGQNIQQAPGLSPINQPNPQFGDQTQQQQLQLRQYRLQQLQLQREQAQKNHLVQQQQGAPLQQPTIVRPIGQPQLADSTTNPPPVPEGSIQHSLVVNPKTKTALANMLNIKLQSGGSSMGVPRPEVLPEPSAAGTLRLMTAQHNAALNSKPQEIIALQRRTITGPNGEIIKPPGAQPLPITPNNEPPKLQYCPKPVLPVQHRPGPFYGHNPNLKLPPDLFLLGCIFVVVELESFLEERIPGWQQQIEKHGGEVEKQYCSRVTHVLCETQRHGVVMQALRDCKRCVTILWLSDVMVRKQVLPPWTALHLPNIYLDTAPASKHLISISGFEGSERNRIKQMIKYTGAKCTTYFSKHNTLLIAAKAEGKKVAYAKKWQIPVVNVQWLTDVVLGNFSAMNQMEHQVYQQFSNPPNFSFDPKLVPNLMHAWKAPINISQESYERVKRSTSPVVLPKKPKKQKTEKTDENDNISDDHITNSTHRILFSMFPDTKPLQKMVRDLGGSVASDHSNFTHLVMPYLARSNKLFFAIAKGAQILSEQWLRDSHSVNHFLPETNYNMNSREFNSEFKCDIDQTLLTANKHRLFEGKFFFVTPSVFPSKKVVVELIQCCGGVVERIRRSSAQIEATSVNSPYSYFIITHEDDLHLVADLLKNKKDKANIVCNVELVYSAVLKQTFEVEPYIVRVL